MKIGVISDTHLRFRGSRGIPPIVFERFEGVDLILHAGDLCVARAVDDLEALAPVVAVRGNNDGPELDLSESRRLELGGCIVGLVHGDRFARGESDPQTGRSRVPSALPYKGNTQTGAFALSHFPDADVVVFGHSHRPLCVLHAREDGSQVLLLNPGSPTDRRFAAHFGIAILEVENGQASAEPILW
jgi:putative phosphoesterase